MEDYRCIADGITGVQNDVNIADLLVGQIHITSYLVSILELLSYFGFIYIFPHILHQLKGI